MIRTGTSVGRTGVTAIGIACMLLVSVSACTDSQGGVDKTAPAGATPLFGHSRAVSLATAAAAPTSAIPSSTIRNDLSISSASFGPWTHPEIEAAKSIAGVVFKLEPNHRNVLGTVSYDTSPPIGGNHSQFWANCTGTVYDHQIANENAVPMLEHGAVWITYNPQTATAADVAKLASLVDGVDRMALSPYVHLKTPVSLQAWGYQLFVNTATDPRVSAFIDALRYNSKTTPELNASCSDPQFNAAASTLGRPFSG